MHACALALLVCLSSVSCGKNTTGSGQPTQGHEHSAKTPATPKPVAAKPSAAEALAATEKQLQILPRYAVHAQIQASGAVAAKIDVQVSFDQAQVRFAYRGSFAGKPVAGEMVSKGTTLATGEPTPTHLKEAIVIGMVRMGLLHNVAVMVAGKHAPDHSDGKVAQWVRALNPKDVSAPTASSRHIGFDLQVAGQPAGGASVRLDSRGLPVERNQTVKFPTGTMQVKETYRVEVTL